MKLSELRNQETGFVVTLDGSPSFRLRLEELGFVPGQEVKRLYASPVGSPIVFAMLGQRVALRRIEAELIGITTERPDENYADEQRVAKNAATATLRRDRKAAPFNIGHRHAPGEPTHPDDFHAMSCSPASCAGCAGCAPRKKLAPKQEGTITIALVGNPNCGKTTVFNAASGGHERTGNYAGVTVSSVVGETCFEGRTIRFVDLPGTYSLRAYSPEEAYVMNELQKGEIDVVLNVLDVNNLERNLLLTLQLRELGIPMVGVLNMYDEFEESGSSLDLERLETHVGMPFVPCVASRRRGIDDAIRSALKLVDAREEALRSGESDPLSSALRDDPHSHADPHALVHHYLSDIYRLREGRAVRLSEMLDKWLAKSGLAYLAFFVVMFLVFHATFTLGAYPMDWMELGIGKLGEVIGSVLPDSWATDLLIDGIIGGVGAVIVFLPNILILYFFISILEDSGYLARAALLFDPLLRRVGLHGKSFFPMLTGFGCNVPAVMATRTIESRKSRLITMVTLPFMSCSARLPVYVVFTAAFFPDSATYVMFGLYVGGILVAFASAWMLNFVIRRREESHFVMEIPPYRRPVPTSVLHHTWEKGRQYLRKMGGLILVASVVVWLLGYFPRAEGDVTPAQQQEQSYLGRAGHLLRPIIEPLGFDWRMGVGILAGAGAKELMVSTLGVLYQLDEESAAAVGSGDDEEADGKLVEAIRATTPPAAGLSYVVFALLYFPCLATIAAIRGESGRWRYALFSAFYSTSLAYVAAWLAFRLAS